jgi:hypothetical protein
MSLTGVSQFTTDPAGAIEQEEEQDVSTIIIQVVEGEPRDACAGGGARARANRAPHRDETRIIVLELSRERRAVGVVVDDDIPPRLIDRDVEFDRVQPVWLQLSRDRKPLKYRGRTPMEGAGLVRRCA